MKKRQKSAANASHSVTDHLSPAQAATFSSHGPSAINDPNVLSRNELIATGAHSRAEQRGFAPGHELDDWLEAERAINERLVESNTSASY